MKARMWRRGSLLGLVLAVTLLAAGCGDGTATTAPAPVDAALAAQVPEAIKDDGKILIGTDPTYAPNEFLKTDGKTEKAFICDVQWDYLGKEILHVDFNRISAEDRVVVTVPLEIRGKLH